jgi:hypothetical protein
MGFDAQSLVSDARSLGSDAEPLVSDAESLGVRNESVGVISFQRPFSATQTKGEELFLKFGLLNGSARPAMKPNRAQFK